MTAAPRFEVVAKLPLLGPLIGWTRRDPERGLTARIWVRVDDSESEPALVALTALAGRDGKVRPGSVQVWKLTRFYPTETKERQWLDFAVADVPLPEDAADCVVRMVSLHRITFAEDGQAASAALDERQAAPKIIKGMGQLEGMQEQLRQLGGTQAEEAFKLLFVAETQLPRPEEIAITELLPALAGRLEGLAERAFRNIESALATARKTATQPIPDTLSRKRLLVREPAECEARLSPATRGQLASARSLAFAAGCCRHPGTGLERELSGRGLQALAAAADSPDGPAFALLTGDQIYADATGGIFDVEERLEKFVARYERAFAAKAFRSLASRVPLYMAADDHEIEDGWSLARTRASNLGAMERAGNQRAYEWARSLFYAHQRLHGPDSAELAGEPLRSRAWYTFDMAGASFFVMDTRLERDTEAPGDQKPPLAMRRLVDGAQLAALGKWLDRLKNQAAPKFIVSGSVFAPGLAAYAADRASARSADNWQGFATERALVAREIASRKLENVVFLSGDYHCGAVGALSLFDGQGSSVRAYAIVSPPFFAPYPFANTRACQVCPQETIHDPGVGAGTGEAIVGECRGLAVEGQGFAVVRLKEQAGAWTIEVEFHKAVRSADRVESTPYFFARLSNGSIDVMSDAA